MVPARLVVVPNDHDSGATKELVIRGTPLANASRVGGRSDADRTEILYVLFTFDYEDGVIIRDCLDNFW
jgi:hypothetical protein